MGTLHDTAALVAALINDGSFNNDFDASLSYDTDLALEDVDALHVDVVGASLNQTADSRVSLQYEVKIDVAVRYRFGVDQERISDGEIWPEEVETYVDLLEQIAEHLANPSNRRLSNKTTAGWLNNDIRIPWSPDHMRNNRQYTGIFRATYIVSKDF